MTSDTSAPPAELVIAVLTYKRVDDIVELAPVLVDHALGLDVPARVVVVDNDPDAGARSAIDALGLSALTYVHEPEPGIAHARNAALDAAAGADLLVFIDDDERPRAGWLDALVATYLETRPAAVAGVVVPEVGSIDDPWIEAGGFFVRQRHRTGDLLPAASTANLLLDLRQLAAIGSPRFDVAFGMTGGSDTMFTRTIVRRGGRIVWCDEAIVVDHIRTARITRPWVLQRAFRSGNSWSRTMIALEQRPVARLVMRPWLSVKGLGRIVGGAGREAFGHLCRNLRQQARGRRSMARGAGMALGAWGVIYDEYGKNRASRAA